MGTRLSEEERNTLSQFHQQQLQEAHIDYIVIGGTWEDRFESAKQVILQRFMR